jgi:hypothetical protein
MSYQAQFKMLYSHIKATKKKKGEISFNIILTQYVKNIILACDPYKNYQ